MRVLVATLLLTLGMLALPAPATATVPDPTLAGSLATTTTEYSLGNILVTDPSLLVLTYPVQLHGQVTAPTTGTGPYPLVVLLHGRHGTCSVLGVEGFGTHVCPNALVVSPIDSYKGYDYLGTNLASNGYVVISIDANQVNDHDLAGDGGANARGQLVLATLDKFATINSAGSTTAGLNALKGRIDMNRIGLMGHSRGGEGIVQASVLNAARASPYALKALFALAPVDFGGQIVKGSAFAVLLPSCDGDVYDLQGAMYFDDSRYASDPKPRPLHQMLVMGANHNYYNTVWTSDDDSGSTDSYCGATVAGNQRLSAVDQRRNGLAFMASFFRLYVGGETSFEPMWRDESAIPVSACPGGTSACPGRFHLSRIVAPADRRVVEDFGTATLGTNDLGGAASYTGFSAASTCQAASCPAAPTVGSAWQRRLEWTSSGAAISQAIPAGSRNWASQDAVTFRVAVDMGSSLNAGAQDLHVALHDTSGTTVTVLASTYSAALFKPQGSGEQEAVLNMVRIPLSAFGAVDLTNVDQLTLKFDATSSGAIQVADLIVQ